MSLSQTWIIWFAGTIPVKSFLSSQKDSMG
jgi:hypothetical protein